MWLKCVQHSKNAIFTAKPCSECDPCWSDSSVYSSSIKWPAASLWTLIYCGVRRAPREKEKKKKRGGGGGWERELLWCIWTVGTGKTWGLGLRPCPWSGSSGWLWHTGSRKTFCSLFCDRAHGNQEEACEKIPEACIFGQYLLLIHHLTEEWKLHACHHFLLHMLLHTSYYKLPNHAELIWKYQHHHILEVH